MEDPTSDTDQGLETLIPELMERAHIPGLQIAVIRDREVAWERGFGLMNADNRTRVATSTVFEAASLTKPLFAYAVMKLVDRGAIELDTPVVEVLPREILEDFLGHSIDAEGYRHEQMAKITPRHILSHASGMRHGFRTSPYTLLFEPGTDWSYSSDGYRLLQTLVEHIQGRPLDETLQSLVLDPLEMFASAMVWRDDFETAMASGHDLYSRPSAIRKRHEPTSSASLYTTADDYARFVLAVMNGRDLKRKTAREMLSWTVDMGDSGDLGWGLGFGLQRYQGDTAFWQWGDYDIFRNYIIASPERGVGVVYLSNSFNGLAICDQLVRACLGVPAMGCLELEYQAYDSPFYEFFWAIESQGAAAVQPRLLDLITDDPEFFTADRIMGMGEILESVGMVDAAAECSRFNLRQHPDSGTMMIRGARAEILVNRLDVARILLERSLTAAVEPGDPGEVNWLLDYLRAIEHPVEIDSPLLQTMAGDYGARHLRVDNGELVYTRDGIASSTGRRLRALTTDTFVIPGVTTFKLRVVLDDQGRAIKLIGVYEGGRQDESLRDQ